MTDFVPTHRITLATGEEILVSLCDDNGGDAHYGGTAGPAYTEQEWSTCTAADYERISDGTWTYQGKAFAGEVTAIITRDEIIDQMIARAVEIGCDAESGPYYTAWPSDSDINRDTQPGDYDYIIQPALDYGLDKDDAAEIFRSEKLHRVICRAAIEAYPEHGSDDV